MGAAPTNLPIQLSSFIGRERELAAVKRLFAVSRLLTLTGAGGTGKTRLALQVAGDSLDFFADGVWWVDLAGLMDDSLVPQQIAASLGVREVANRTVREALVNYIQSKQMLLLLDNCEHLVDACALLVEYLLGACPYLRIVITSRQALGLFGETVYPVPTLPVPGPEAPLSAGSLMQYDSIRLFVERARGVKPELALTEKNAAAVVEICQRLDGMPLAIELAAARARLLSVEHIAERLTDRFSLLTAGSRTALPRHQTLRATIDWSYDLLPGEARLLFRRLSVFAGGFSLPAAEGIGSDERLPSTAVFDLLARLVDRSLVNVEPSGENERYRLLDTIRQYATEKLVESGDIQSVRDRHLAFSLSLAREGEPNLSGREAPGWLSEMELERDNLRAALNWALENGAAESVLELATALLRYWRIHGPVGEGRAWLRRFLAAAESSDRRDLRARALFAAANLAWWQSDLGEARPLYEASLELGRELADKRIIGWALFALGALSEDEGDSASAKSLCEEALALLEQVGDRWGADETMTVLALLAWRRGDTEEARRLFERELASEQELGTQLGTANASCWLAYVEMDAGNPERARALIRQALLTDKSMRAENYSVDRIEAMAAVAAAEHDERGAALLLGASQRLRTVLGYPRNTGAHEFYSRHLQHLPGQLDNDPAIRKAWGEGQAMSLEEAIDYALQWTEPVSHPAPTPSALGRGSKQEFAGLSPREREVAALIAEGESNREIAGRLVVSERTVETHVSNILNKLGLTNRAQIRRWAREEGLDRNK